MVYCAPASSTVFNEMEGPPAPLEPVVVSRLNEDPVYAAAFDAIGVLAPLNDVQPSAVPSAKLYVATTWALTGNDAHRAVPTRPTPISSRRTRLKNELSAARNILLPPISGVATWQRAHQPVEQSWNE